MTNNKGLDTDKSKKTNADTLKNIGIAHGLRETTDRYGNAITEDFVAYSGQRMNADGSRTSYQKSHSKISTHKLNDKYHDKNVAQQAGYNAEVQEVANRNKEAIINKDSKRWSRTDDLKNQDGTSRVNDPIADLVQLDELGNTLYGSEGQMKFVKNVDNLCDAIAGKGSKDLTRYQGEKLILPPEQVDSAKEYCKAQAEKCRKQAERLKDENPTLSTQKQEQAKQFENLNKNIVEASLSSDQAKAYRLNPITETAKSIGGTAHASGLQGAKCGAAIGGAISVITNVFAVYQDDKKLSAALMDCTLDTTKAAVFGYGTAALGSAVKGTAEQAYGVMVQTTINKATKDLKGKVAQKAADIAVEKLASSTAGKVALKANALSKTALPVLAVTICLEAGGLIRKYAKGEIDGIQLMEQAGERGIGLLSSSGMAAIGQIAIPIPVVGAIIGGMIGYTLSSMFYNEALSAFKGAKKAREDYLVLKANYEEAKCQRDIYQTEMNRLFAKHMDKQKELFSVSFQQIDLAIESGDMASFATAINGMGEMFGKQFRFNDRNEFDEFMKTDEVFVL